jgi:hypothetical protein
MPGLEGVWVVKRLSFARVLMAAVPALALIVLVLAAAVDLLPAGRESTGQAADRAMPAGRLPASAFAAPSSVDETLPPNAAPRVGLTGDEVSPAVATYGIDRDGNLFEVHSPQTEEPRLGSPIG